MLRHPLARCLAALLGVMLAGCSLTLSGDDGELPLIGAAIPAEQFPKLNANNVGSVATWKGEAGAVWAVLFEWHDGTAGDSAPYANRGSTHLWRLDQPAADERYDSDGVIVGQRLVYVILLDADAAKPTRVRLIEPGHGAGSEMELPAGVGTFVPSPRDDAFLLKNWGPGLAEIVARSDGSYQRTLPPARNLEGSTTPHGNDISLFDATGSWLIRQELDGKVTLFSTRDERQIDLGVQTRLAGSDDEDPVFYTCGESGLVRVPIQKKMTSTVLDKNPCRSVFIGKATDELDGALREGTLLYHGSADYFLVNKQGSSIEHIAIPPGSLLLALSPQKRAAYTRDSIDEYSNERGDAITDGWLPDWRFMNRGRDVRFSPDGSRIYWLDNAARSDDTGDLMGGSISAGASSVQLLARNVYQYALRSDGRVLAVSNAANYNLQSRLILIDEAAQVARRVAEDARGFYTIPGSTDLLVEVWASGSHIDLYRVPTE